MTSTSRKYDLVVFDWDGTVMDTTGLIAEGKGDVMITETMEAKLYAKKYAGKLHAAFIENPLTPKSVMGFWMPADDAEYLRVMRYLWDITELRGEHAALAKTWLE